MMLHNLEIMLQRLRPTCMLYKNYTARAINPRIYNKPYIGLGAIKIQLATIEQELET